ncbi:MAG: tol-pal system protein YbgF [Candidatus Nitrotoga sp.]
MKFRILLFVGLLGGLGQAQAFFDDEAHNQLRLVRERMSSLEATSKRQADTNEQQGREIVDFREQVEAEKLKFKALLSQYEMLNNVLNSTQQIIESQHTEHKTYIQDLKAQLVSLGEKVSPVEKRGVAIQELQARLDKIGEQVSSLDVSNKQQTDLVRSLQASSQAISSQMDQAIQQQIKSMVSLQGAADGQSAELRSIKGLNEDLTNKLQSLDARMHQFEAALVSEVKKKSHDEQLLMKQQSAEGAALRSRNDKLEKDFLDASEKLEKELLDIKKHQSEFSALSERIHHVETVTALELKGQIETQKEELNTLRDQNKRLSDNLQSAEKRQKVFYDGMDASLRNFEAIVAGSSRSALPADEGSVYELAYAHVKAGSHQDAIGALEEFIKKYPGSPRVANARYEVGNACFALKDYQGALKSYQLLEEKYPSNPNVPDAMLNMAESQQQLKAVNNAKKTLRRVIAKFPKSKAATQARERLNQ